jgi:propanol-preferring alcohol dehydrogenase
MRRKLPPFSAQVSPFFKDSYMGYAAHLMCIVGTTVYKALKSAQLTAGQWVAIVGAGGGLGHLCVAQIPVDLYIFKIRLGLMNYRAIQYAKAQGLKVLGIDGGEDKGALCAKLGADAFIDFTKTKVLQLDPFVTVPLAKAV